MEEYEINFKNNSININDLLLENEATGYYAPIDYCNIINNYTYHEWGCYLFVDEDDYTSKTFNNHNYLKLIDRFTCDLSAAKESDIIVIEFGRFIGDKKVFHLVTILITALTQNSMRFKKHLYELDREDIAMIIAERRANEIDRILL